MKAHNYIEFCFDRKGMKIISKTIFEIAEYNKIDAYIKQNTIFSKRIEKVNCYTVASLNPLARCAWVYFAWNFFRLHILNSI